jgi:hypothetical protein
VVPIQFPDGVYDRTHTWQNANDRVEYERTVSQDPIETAKIMSALATADPSMPDAVIQESMTALPSVPLAPSEPVTVMECFGRDLGHVNDYAPTNFSGKQSQFSGSSIPSMPSW